ncbi:MAG: glycosyltransferase [Candidatus Moranbacteria bacterium]|nr:glycosyltransferase [Candidatus Moranbacteria bacterium]
MDDYLRMENMEKSELLNINRYLISPNFVNQEHFFEINSLRFLKHVPILLAACLFLFLLSVVVLYKIVYYLNIEPNNFWYIYSLLAGTFLVSRLPLAFMHKDAYANSREKNDNYIYPNVSFIIAAKNEEESIYKTIEACMESDYPAEMECIAIDDGSTDKTLSEMQRASVAFGSDEVRAVTLGVNKGKREAMFEGVRLSKNEIIVFVDSDSFLEKGALRLLIHHFSDDKVGAVSGNTGVANHCSNLLTKMQSIRYAVSFDIFKSSESYFGVVTCCPGCFSAYRMKAITPVLSSWRNQMFMGTRSTFGDDRSLTNFVLRDWKVAYCESAKATTIVPEKYMKFLKQQLRWKKSWIREGFVSSSFMWKKHPIAALSFYVNLILPTLGPFVVGWVLYMTIAHYNLLFLITFLFGVTTVGLLYSTFLFIIQREKYWLYMPAFSIFYTLIMIWQMPYAILTLRKTHWGTR